jgi:hypothetical protein
LHLPPQFFGIYLKYSSETTLFFFSLSLKGAKPRILSKKEQDEIAAAKRGQGNRTAKTGSRRHKFDPEAHAEKGKK